MHLDRFRPFAISDQCDVLIALHILKGFAGYLEIEDDLDVLIMRMA